MANQKETSSPLPLQLELAARGLKPHQAKWAACSFHGDATLPEYLRVRRPCTSGLFYYSIIL